MTAAAGFTNAGIIALDSIGTGWAHATLAVTSGTLTNTGVISVNVGIGGERKIEGSLINNGTVNINADAWLRKQDGVYTNNSAFNIATGKTLTMDGSNNTFNQNGGTLAVNGTFNTVNNTFTFNGGTITGSPDLTNSALNIGAGSTGVGTVTVHGTGSGIGCSLSGDIASGQTVVVQGVGGLSDA